MSFLNQYAKEGYMTPFGWIENTVETSTSTGISSVSLNQVTDVTITSPTDGQALVYDSATSEWINGNANPYQFNYVTGFPGAGLFVVNSGRILLNEESKSGFNVLDYWGGVDIGDSCIITDGADEFYEVLLESTVDNSGPVEFDISTVDETTLTNNLTVGKTYTVERVNRRIPGTLNQDVQMWNGTRWTSSTIEDVVESIAGGSIAIGSSSIAQTACVSIGNSSSASVPTNISIGNASTASSTNCISIGANSLSNFSNCIAIGRSATGNEKSVVVGNNSICGPFSTIIGDSVNSDGFSNNVVLGHKSVNGGNNSIVLGTGISGSNSGNFSIVMGDNAENESFSSIVIGANSKAPVNLTNSGSSLRTVLIGTDSVLADDVGNGTVAVGSEIVGEGVNITIVGGSASTAGSLGGSTAIGKSTQATTNATSIGNNSVASGLNSVALGGSSTASGVGSFAVGNNSVSSGSNSIAMGQFAKAGDSSFSAGFRASQNDAVANSIALGFLSMRTSNAAGNIGIGANCGLDCTNIGSSNTLIGTDVCRNIADMGNNNVCVGTSGSVVGANNVTIGANSESSSSNSVVVGQNSSSSVPNSVCLGFASTCGATGSIVIGSSGKSTGANSICIGTNVNSPVTVVGEDSISIGRNSQAGDNSISLGNGMSSSNSDQFAVKVGTTEFITDFQTDTTPRTTLATYLPVNIGGTQYYLQLFTT